MNYFNANITLQDGVEELSNPELDFEKNRDDVNILIYNTILQYLTTYLGIESSSIEQIKNDVEDIMNLLVGLKKQESKINGHISEENEFGNNHYSIGCLLDILQTSSIVKEIIFGKYQDINNGYFKSVDLGSGTGILSLGALISAKRNGYKKGELNMYDLSKNSIFNSKKILEGLSKNFKVNGYSGNIFKQNLSNLGDLGDLNMWISETISDITPAFGYDAYDKEITKYADDEVVLPFDFLKGNTNETITQELIDPFPNLFEKSMQEIPNFIENVKSRKTFMFPDYINKKYIPDQEDSKIQLDTYLKAGKLYLGNIGEEFEQYPKIYSKDSRWLTKKEREKRLKSFIQNII